MEHQPCPNVGCAQYRIQHRNMTMKKLELEKELEQIKRTQNTTFNDAVSRNAVTQFRDAATGEMGLMMPNGEVMTREKVLKKIEIANKCMETSCAYEKKNRELVEEIKFIKIGSEKAYTEMRRLEKILAGFERTKTFEFTEEQHKQTVKINEELASEVEALEYDMHRLQEENALLARKNERMKREIAELKRNKTDSPTNEQPPKAPRIMKRKQKRNPLDDSDDKAWQRIPVTPRHPQSPEMDFGDE